MEPWHIPDWWQFLILGLGAYRLTRLAGWDEFPLAVNIRRWVIGEHWVPLGPWELPDATPADLERIAEASVPAGVEKVEGTGRVDTAQLGLPGKQPTTELSNLRAAYRRPVLAHLVHCPFCAGWWISLAVYAGWLAAPRATLYAMTPFALSAAVGLIAKNLDP